MFAIHPFRSFGRHGGFRGPLLTAALAICSALLWLASVPAHAQGDLLVTPTRVLLEGTKKNEMLTLVNRGSDTATYELVVVQYRMTPDGRLTEITAPDSGQMFATDQIRFFPRRVTLAPNEAQNVRVQLRAPSGIADGEYRSHLLFRAVPRPVPAVVEPALAETELGVKITPLFGVSIPVIIRHGSLNASVMLDDVQLIPAAAPAREPMLSMNFTRSGNESVYGDLRVRFHAADGTTTDLATIRGVAVYTPNIGRSLRIPIAIPSGLQLAGGRISVEYIDRNDPTGTPLASSGLTLR